MLTEQEMLLGRRPGREQEGVRGPGTALTCGSKARVFHDGISFLGGLWPIFLIQSPS